jgi:hypothetical protein
MGVLMLKCRTTGREFSTGIYAEEETFNRLPDIVAEAACPHCGRLHSWRTREARVSEGDDFPNLRKTEKACQAEWQTDKAANQANGIAEKAYVTDFQD